MCKDDDGRSLRECRITNAKIEGVLLGAGVDAEKIKTFSSRTGSFLEGLTDCQVKQSGLIGLMKGSEIDMGKLEVSLEAAGLGRLMLKIPSYSGKIDLLYPQPSDGSGGGVIVPPPAPPILPLPGLPPVPPSPAPAPSSGQRSVDDWYNTPSPSPAPAPSSGQRSVDDWYNTPSPSPAPAPSGQKYYDANGNEVDPETFYDDGSALLK